MYDEEEEALSFLKDARRRRSDEERSRSSQVQATLPWGVAVLSAILLLIQSIYFQSVSRSCQEKGSYESGFETDFDEAKAHIKLETRRFTHALKVDENGTLYPALDPVGPLYAGPPSPEIDAAWDELTGKRYFRFTSDEVSELKSDQFDRVERIERLEADMMAQPGYYGGVDFLHSLHCVNALRKQVNLEYYEPMMHLPPKYRQMHIWHCIDQLRQQIMCHGDLTPVTLLPIWQNEAQQALLGQTERLHTCRDAASLRRWTVERGQRTGALGH